MPRQGEKMSFTRTQRAVEKDFAAGERFGEQPNGLIP